MLHTQRIKPEDVMSSDRLSEFLIIVGPLLVIAGLLYLWFQGAGMH